jgi:hypothetical protein
MYSEDGHTHDWLRTILSAFLRDRIIRLSIGQVGIVTQAQIILE